MAELTQSQITEAFLDALRRARSENIFSGGGGGGGSPTSPSPSSPSATTGFTETVKKEAAGVGNSFVAVGKAGLDVADKLLTGGATVGTYTKALQQNFASLGGGSSVLGKGFAKATEALGALGENLDNNINTWRELSKVGASFGNDIISMKVQAADARMSIAEMGEIVQKNSATLAGLGPTVSQSIAAFTRVSKEMYDSGAGEQLRQMGYTTKDLNDVLAVSLSNRKISDLRDKESREKAYQSAASLATEMDAVAKITGKNKQEQLDELRRREADGQRQAAIDSAVAKGGENAKAAFDILETTSKAGGANFQKLAQDIAAMKRPSEGMEEAYAALGPSAQKYLQMAGEAARSGNEKAAQEYTKMALEARANFQKTDNYRTLAAQGLKSFSDQYGEGGAFRKSMDAAGGSVKDLDKNVKAAQQGLEVDPTTGERISKDSTKAITEFAVNVENRGRDLTKVLANEVIKPLSDPIGKTLAGVSKDLSLTDPKKVTELETGMRTGRVKYQANAAVQENVRAEGGIRESDKAYPELVKLTQLLGSTATKEKTNTELNAIAEKQGKSVKDVIDAAMANKGAGLAELNKQLSAGLTPEEIRKSQTEKKEKEQKLKEGPQGTGIIEGVKDRQTLPESMGQGVGALGNLFTPSTPGYVNVTNLREIPGRAVGGYVEKPSLSYLAENGPEFVLNQPQMKSLIEGLGGQGIDISKISKEVSTTISSVSGGNATTVKGPDLAELAKPLGRSINELAQGSFGSEIGAKANLSNISFGPNGMPSFRQAEAARQSLPDRSPEKEAEAKAKQAEAARALEDSKKVSEGETTKTTAPGSKSTNLDDVVKQLNQLNTLMSQFVDDHKDLGAKQIRAARSSSANINERV